MSGQLRLLSVMGAAAGIAPFLLACFGEGSTVPLVDPDGPVKALALRDAKAAAQLNESQVWQDYSPCWQAANPKDAWIRARYVGHEVRPVAAPADAQYAVVAVQADGIYRRVEVRVTASGYQPLDYEIDVRQWEGQWVKVDSGALGHIIHDDCPGARR